MTQESDVHIVSTKTLFLIALTLTFIAYITHEYVYPGTLGAFYWFALVVFAILFWISVIISVILKFRSPYKHLSPSKHLAVGVTAKGQLNYLYC